MPHFCANSAATSLVGSTAHGRNRSLANEFIINDMHEAAGIGRAGAADSPRSSKLFTRCFPQGFPHCPPQNRSANGGSFDAFLLRNTAHFIIEVTTFGLAFWGGRFGTESTP